MTFMNMRIKFQESLSIIKRDILVQKLNEKKQIFKFTVSSYGPQPDYFYVIYTIT